MLLPPSLYNPRADLPRGRGDVNRCFTLEMTAGQWHLSFDPERECFDYMATSLIQVLKNSKVVSQASLIEVAHKT